MKSDFEDIFSEIEEDLKQTSSTLNDEVSVKPVDEPVKEALGESYDDGVYSIYSSPGYPSDFPKLAELQDLKNKHRDMFFCVVGSHADLLLGVALEPFLIRKAKQSDILKFSAEGGDYRNVASFDAFLVRECVVYPEQDTESVDHMGVGTLNFLAVKIRNYSKLGSQGFIRRV